MDASPEREMETELDELWSQVSRIHHTLDRSRFHETLDTRSHIVDGGVQMLTSRAKGEDGVQSLSILNLHELISLARSRGVVQLSK